MPDDTLAPIQNDSQASNQPPKPAFPPTAYTLAEAATILRRSPKTVRRLIERGKLRRDTTFGRVMIPRKDVDTFIEKHSAYAFTA